ncbi:unnamed protein product [Merluccius merluccius]
MAVFQRLSAHMTQLNDQVHEEEPMQLASARLFSAECHLRMNFGACIYYGQLGHRIANCPLRPKDESRR